MKAILSFALVAWFFGVLFFVNRAKSSHCVPDSGIVERPIVLDGKPIIAFEHYKQVPDTSIAFHYLRDSLKRQMERTDKLKIVGYFTKTESEVDRNLGLKRANAVRSLFEGYVDLASIEIESEISDKIGSGAGFDILRDRLTENVLDTPMPPMMAENISLPKEAIIAKSEKETLNVAVSGLTSSKEEPKSSVGDELNAPDYIVYFKNASSDIVGAQEVQQYLNALSKRVKKSKEKIEIVGFDDNDRSNTESMELSKRRTWRVRRAFKDDYVRRKLVKVKNIGQSQPIESNETAEGRSKNRRVEIRILKK